MGACPGHTEFHFDLETNYEAKSGSISLSDDFDFIPQENRLIDFQNVFEAMDELGSGSTCSVWCMRHKTTDRPCAVKQMRRSRKTNPRLFKQEAEILLKISHDHIVGLVGLYVDHTNFYIAQELCTGGMLIERVKQAAFSEQQVIEITYQILDAVQFLHDHNIVHRDIKPDNVMFQNTTNNRVVLIDFGHATQIRDSDEFNDWVGTPVYMAPEMIRTRSGADLKKVDIWAVGITVYVLLTRHLPFFGKDVKSLFKIICRKPLSFPDLEDGSEVPEMAQGFIKGLLKRHMAHRPSASEAMEHPWLESERSRATFSIRNDRVSLDENSSKLEQSGVNVSIEKMDDVAAVFSMVDDEEKGYDGYYLKENGRDDLNENVEEEDGANMIAKVDANGFKMHVGFESFKMR